MDDETCNTEGPYDLKLILKTPVPLTWIRLVMRNEVELSLNAITTHWTDVGGTFKYKAVPRLVVKVNEKTLDVVYETTLAVQYFWMDRVADLCSVYISKGCPLRRYGTRCLQTCNANCGGSDDACDYINGTCTNGCKNGYTGDMCDMRCPSGHYGGGCNKNCSEGCGGDTHPCHHVNGFCDLGCEPGYQGALCTQTKNEKDDHIVGLAVIVTMVVLFVISVITNGFFVYRRLCQKKNERPRQQEQEDNGTGLGDLSEESGYGNTASATNATHKQQQIFQRV
ncbi:multiple epidermal growth factor-like domains 10 [Elysia marginata]|uniref:Multiple epidermal growth factor-like domains 10 n=1 Tax=Elysia marginata TaxID=1093978 RepID=A0AAV4EMA9_9GAST|nr:multiple epidermal growth factor-like domains 10 [Elysia marginata]